MKRKYEIQVTNHESRTRAGSALILAVVLTSLLAIVGVMFLMVARVDRMATSGISENKELNSAVETVIAKISQELVLDTPGAVDPNEEYYDYPDSANRWLASLEPYEFGGIYYWRQISDVSGFLSKKNFPRENVDVDPPGIRKYIREYPQITLDINGELVEQSADADGDGIADSKWIELNDITSSKGKPIYAAIRVVDNGGMLNVNTAYKFDPNDSLERINGSSQMQINLMGLSERDQTHTSQQKIDRLWSFRAGLAPNDVSSYEQNVVWQYGNPTSGYIPFDISDEMKLRNRYLLNYNKITTRIEKLWTNAYDGGPEMPLPTEDYTLSRWLDCATFDLAAPNDYDYRHIGTTYNMDRIINPVGPALNNGKMVNVNVAGKDLLYYAIRTGLDDADVPGPNSLAAQMAVNIVDYRDDNNDVSTILVDGDMYYGFERPCIYISELVYKEDVNDPAHRSYAIELYKPYFKDNDPCGWRLVIDGSSIDITWSGTKQFHVVLFEDSNAPLTVSPTASIQPTPFVVFDVGDLIELRRFVADVNNYIVVDSVQVPAWLPAGAGIQSCQRDITLHKCIRRLWADASEPNSLGDINTYKPVVEDWIYIQAHPADKDFTNIGDIGMVFCRNAYTPQLGVYPPTIIGYNSETEDKVRIDVNAPIFQQIFNYLTVFDPTVDGIDNNGDGYGAGANMDPNELKIPGRININTAPWFVIAQLPWMRYNAVGYDYLRAQAIVADRDLAGAFKSIGELMRVGAMLSLGLDASDNLNSDIANPGPDFTDDSATNDFEERDLIFARISNLVTVRSDVFTAYILVRIGADGPQKRVIAILDRSNVYSGNDRVRIVALHPVPDPR